MVHIQHLLQLEISSRLEFNNQVLKDFELYNNQKHIIRKCIQGDRKAQQELFGRYNALLYKVSYNYMNHIQNAEEVLQDSWIDIFNSLGRYEDQGKFEGWLKTIVIRRAWKALKKRKYVEEITDDFVKSTVNMEKQIMDQMTCNEILNELEIIPNGAREVFKMAVIDGFNHQEIADILEISPSTSRAHLSRARKILQKKYSNQFKISS